MASSALRQCEQDVERARAKLANDLAMLRAPSTFSEFTDGLKHEAMDLKDAMMDKAKSSAQSTIDGVIEDVKGRIAANPAAALAIGAGIAWRLMQHPPIASVLVGAGLVSLFRTTAAHPGLGRNQDYVDYGKRRLKRQAADFAESAKEAAVSAGHAAAAKASDAMDATKEKAEELSAAAQDKARHAGSAAMEGAQSLGRRSSQAMQDAAAGLRNSADSLLQRSSEALGDARSAFAAKAEEFQRQARGALDGYSAEAQNTAANISARSREILQDIEGNAASLVPDQDARDKLLLGLAGTAVVAALAFAYQKRNSETADG